MVVPLRQVRQLPRLAPLVLAAVFLLGAGTSGGAASDPLPGTAEGSALPAGLLPTGDNTCTLLAAAASADPREEDGQGSRSGPTGALVAPCTGRISPGARISTATGMCSLGFILRDEADAWYATTAGHCIDAVGDPVTVPSIGKIGVAVYRIADGVGADFALLRIDDDVTSKVDPAMCHWGGPTEEATSRHGVVRHYGFGTLHDATTFSRARSGVTYAVEAERFTFLGTVASGDSGAAVRLADGGALGIITNVNLQLQGVAAHSAPFVYGTTLTHGIALAEADLGIGLTLQTAPVTDVL